MPCFINYLETWELTKSAIDSLGKVNLIVIDNESNLAGGYLREVADTYIRNQTNLGYARAVNQGLALAKTDFIAIVNNDTRVSPNWQEVAQEVFMNPDTYSCHFRMTNYEVPFEYGKTILYSGKERWCTSSFFVINTQKMKFFYDENYFNTCDDWDYWKQVRLSGLKTAYTDLACYQHKHSHTQQQIPERIENDKKNREYFKQKWGMYPEEDFAKQYPLQMKINYWDGFAI